MLIACGVALTQAASARHEAIPLGGCPRGLATLRGTDRRYACACASADVHAGSTQAAQQYGHPCMGCACASMIPPRGGGGAGDDVVPGELNKGVATDLAPGGGAHEPIHQPQGNLP